uniref:ADP-ribosyl cyclase/cyclic ADP-ribose hydrolase n=1 Tax=Solanum tuberosum TaxID=4113 RepID=Q6XZH6_SOLTU|nr:nematode resistance-like protein [Solanum tuberosum]
MNQESSLLPSPEIIRWSYDVFLSFRGEDVRKTFVDHLYLALQQKCINTFKDDEKLEKGKFISPELMSSIEESRIALIIFSKNYANSTWCLDELTKIMECKNVKGQIVVPVFYDVDPSTVRKQKSIFGEAFSKHEARFQEDKVQKWRAALEEAANISGWDLPNTSNGHEARVMEKIAEDIMARLGSQRHASNARNLVGMESHMLKVYKMLGIGSGGVHFLGILGMSGVGKTTLARVIYDNIRSQFQGACFLHEVRDRSAKQGLERLQEILLSEILVVKKLRINNSFEGANMQKQRLQYKKVLLVLDDVDHIDQLNALAGEREWFGDGSRIIITTKDKHLLVKYETEKIYRMKTLNNYESLQLFKQHAFKKNRPTKEFEDLSAQVIKHTDGLPLALKVLGSFLYGRGLDEWISEVERLKQIPENEILKKLEQSFTGLHNTEQKIFLDIACFFSGKKKDSVTRILESFHFCPVIGIKVLMEKCLITILQGRITIHQLIQDMGWHIVRREATDDPRMCSRLWKREDICPVLERNLGTDKNEGMSLHLTNEEEVNFGGKAFMQMTRLRFLKFRNAYVCQGPEFLPDELRWLDWHGYPSKSLPNSFKGDQLVGLKLKKSRIIQLWKTSKDLGKLKYMNLSHSQKLIRTPDFSVTPNLERLVLEECTSLVEINFSIENLGKLVLLNLKNCRNLKTLPKRIRLEKLEILVLTGCSKLRTFPEIEEKMNCLAELYLGATSLSGLPASVENLSGVGVINLSYCKHLESLPSSIFRLKCLKTLDVSGCSKLKNLPDDLGLLVGLEKLHCTHTAIHTIPSSMSLLKNLKRLSLRGCNALSSQVSSSSHGQKSMGVNFQNLSGLCSLIRLDLSDCDISDGGILRNLGFLSSLKVLLLDGNNFSNIPAASISRLTRLKSLALRGCGRLESLPELPPSITGIYAHDCTSLMSIDQLTKYPMLSDVSFRNCHQLVKNKQHTSMVDSLLKQMLEALYMNVRFGLYVPGMEIPEWFTYKSWGTQSMSVVLPTNWFTPTFRGFTVCVLFDKWMPMILGPFNLHKVYGLKNMIWLNLKRYDGLRQKISTSFGPIGSEKPGGLGNTLITHVAFGSSWQLEDDLDYYRNNAFQLEFSACDHYQKDMVKGLGVRLVYEN